MSAFFERLMALMPSEGRAGDVVPPSGATAVLTIATAAAMAFLAVFALALALAAGRLADRWSEALSQGATIRIAGPAEGMEAATRRVLAILAETPGVASARPLDTEEMKALLAPWLGSDLPVESLPLPQLIEIVETGQGLDAGGLGARLAAEAPEATLDDHESWRRPLISAAERLRGIGILSLVLIGGAMAAMVTLAARAALAANGQVIQVLRLVGARDAFIARAFVRRFTLRAGAGALAGTLAGMASVALLPAASQAGGFLTGLGFSGAGWLAPLAIPALTAIVAFAATRAAAFRSLREVQ